MIPVSNAWYCQNFYTSIFATPGIFGGSVEPRPDLKDYWSLDLDFSNYSRKSHSISFQTERYEGAVQEALDAKPVSSGKGKTVKDSTFPDRPPQQLSGMGFDALPSLSVKGYLIDQGIRTQQLVESGGMSLGSLAIFFSPIPGTFLATKSREVEESIRRFGYLPPVVF